MNTLKTLKSCFLVAMVLTLIPGAIAFLHCADGTVFCKLPNGEVKELKFSRKMSSKALNFTCGTLVRGDRTTQYNEEERCRQELGGTVERVEVSDWPSFR